MRSSFARKQTVAAALHRRLAAGVALFVVCVLPTAGSDWPVYRGPTMNLAASGSGLFTGGGEYRLEVVWKRELGSGYSGISIQEGIAVTLFSDDGFDFAGAFDTADGSELWRFRLDGAYPGHFGSQDGPISTPLIVENRVFALAPRGRLVALDLETGKRRWERNLTADLGAVEPFYGFSTSPIHYEGSVIVQTGGPEGTAVAAFDAHTGAVRWRAGTDTVEYQSPVLMTIGGKTQLVSVGNSRLIGLEPGSGRVLWQHDFEGDGAAIGSASTNIVMTADQSVLIKDSRSSSKLLGLGRGEKALEVEEVWKTSFLKNSYVVPVYHAGFFYGYNTRILSCVDAGSGEMVWRSRTPGDGFPILIDGHLAIVTKGGTLSLAPASPQGYQEVASVELFDDLVWTPPSFASGSLYLRSLSEMARVAIVPARTRLTVKREEVGMIADSEFGRFVQELESASDKSARLDAFFGSQERFPLIEGDNMVHFVYRGREKDVGLVSDLIGGRTDRPMNRVEGTDFFYFSAELEPDARISYGFLKDFEELETDELNPVKARLWPDFELSSLSMPGWEEPEHLAEPQGARGRIESLELEMGPSEEGTEENDLLVYLPRGYDQLDQRYPVIYVHDGKPAPETGLWAHTLDNLIGRTVAPVIVVFLPSFQGGGYTEFVGEGRDEYARIVVEKIVPLVDRKYSTIRSADARANVGASLAAYASFYATVRHPELFRRLGLQTMTWEPAFERQNGELLAGPVALPLVIYLDWGKYDGRSPMEGWNFPQSNRTFARTLEEKGYSFTGGEVNEGRGWASWRSRTDKLLETLFPSGWDAPAVTTAQ
jgi:enterochelin esterase-like enzyme/outer membrane protein assembly factor BamB